MLTPYILLKVFAPSSKVLLQAGLQRIFKLLTIGYHYIIFCNGLTPISNLLRKSIFPDYRNFLRNKNCKGMNKATGFYTDGSLYMMTFLLGFSHGQLLFCPDILISSIYLYSRINYFFQPQAPASCMDLILSSEYPRIFFMILSVSSPRSGAAF